MQQMVMKTECVHEQAALHENAIALGNLGAGRHCNKKDRKQSTKNPPMMTSVHAQDGKLTGKKERLAKCGGVVMWGQHLCGTPRGGGVTQVSPLQVPAPGE